MPPICRHRPDDPSCSSYTERTGKLSYRAQEERERQAAELHKQNAMRVIELQKQLDEMTPKNNEYEFLDVARVGPHLVGKVKYLSCPKCSYEGIKVMVWLNVPEAVVLRWRVIDPHFRERDKSMPATHAPGPDARFPASEDGWNDALAYARSKLSRE